MSWRTCNPIYVCIRMYRPPRHFKNESNSKKYHAEYVDKYGLHPAWQWPSETRKYFSLERLTCFVVIPEVNKSKEKWHRTLLHQTPSASPNQSSDKKHLSYVIPKLCSRREWLHKQFLATSTSLRAGIPNSGEGEIFRSCPDRPWGPSSLQYNEYRVSFPGVKRPGSWPPTPI